MDIETGRPETDGSSLLEAQQPDAGAVGTVQSVAEQWARGRSFSLAQMLLDASIIPAEEVDKAQEAAWKERQPLGHILVRDGLVLSRDLATLIALNLGLPMVDLRRESIDKVAVAKIPEEVARKYLVLAVNGEENRLSVAMADPTDLQLLQDLAARTGCIIEPVVTTAEDIQEHVDLFYRLTRQLADTSSSAQGEPSERVTAKRVREALPAQVIDLLLRQALQDRASDIHIEPAEDRLRIRFRIDGILHEVMTLPIEMHPTIISRLKIMCGLNIAERRRPQDGQLNFEVQDRTVDVRVAISGTVGGEMAVLRLLDNKKFTLLGLDQLGLLDETQEQYTRLLKLPYGMVIICGPTGSGKSTTLYASVLQMNRMENKVISIEDPVEYHMPNVSQMQVHTEAGITFASQLRSILRLDPDVILIGEIRDQETAVIATQAALTGHLVLTSLHANDTVSGLIRLRDLGVPAYLIASSVAGVVAQRMVRRVCNTCRTLTQRPFAEQQAYASEMEENQDRFVYGSGCNVCAQTGYYGRTGVFEILTMSDTLRQLFLENAPRHQLFNQSQLEGMTYLRRDGMQKVKAGITTPYEVMRVLFTLD
jgi:general secretion pathway protein E